MSYRSTASFGKRQEIIAVAELLKRGHDVYLPMVDDQGIDCIVRKKEEKDLKYLDIQIKARSKTANNPGTFAVLNIPDPRENYFFIFYSEAIDTYWVISSLDLVKEANQNKSGDNEGKYKIKFCNINKSGPKARPRFKKYENAFNVLDN